MISDRQIEVRLGEIQNSVESLAREADIPVSDVVHTIAVRTRHGFVGGTA